MKSWLSDFIFLDISTISLELIREFSLIRPCEIAGEHIILIFQQDAMTGNKEDKAVGGFDDAGKLIDSADDICLGCIIVLQYLGGNVLRFK